MPSATALLQLTPGHSSAVAISMGSEEIREYEEELNGLVDEISGGLLGLKKPKLNATVKSERIHELSGRMQRAKTVLQSYKVEMRDLPREQAALYDLRLREIQQRLQTMFTELQVSAHTRHAQASSRTPKPRLVNV